MLKLPQLVVLTGILWFAVIQTSAASTRLPKKPTVGKAVGLKSSNKPEARPAKTDEVEAVYPDLSPEQLAVADKVAVGKIPCELAAHVTISPDVRSAGRFILELGRDKHRMEPVLTSTGAVRLEDATSGAVWLQLANKSMLMNQKLGKRLADECMTAAQMIVAQELIRSPAPSLLEPLGAPEAIVSATK
jgi:hypothetical protein